MAKEVKVSRMLAQTAATSIRSVSLEKGDECIIQDFLERNIKVGTGENVREIESDSILVRTTRKDQPMMSIPAREYLRMQPSNGELYNKDGENGVKATLPTKIVVTGVEPRTNQDGTPAYPAGAYKGAQDFYDGKISNYQDLLATGLKDEVNGNPGGFPQLKKYTVEVS